MQQIGDTLSFNGTDYLLLRQLRFNETGNPRKEICVQQLQDLASNDIQIRFCWWLDGQFMQQALMTSEIDLQRIKVEIANW